MVSKFKLKELFSIHAVSVLNTILSFLLVRTILNFQSELFYTNWTTILKSILIIPILLEFKIKDIVKNDNKGNSLFSIFIISEFIVIFYVIDDFNFQSITSCLLLGFFAAIQKLIFENCLIKYRVDIFILSSLFRQLSMIFLFYQYDIKIWQGIYFFSFLYLFEIIFVINKYKLPTGMFTNILSNSLKFKIKDFPLMLISVSGAIYQLHLLSTINSHVDSVIILLLIQLSLVYSQFGNSINQITYKYGITNKLSVLFQIILGVIIFVFLIFLGKPVLEILFDFSTTQKKVNYYSLILIYFIVRFIYNNLIYKSLSIEKYIVGIIPLAEAILFIILIFFDFDILLSMFIAMICPLILYNLFIKKL